MDPRLNTNQRIYLQLKQSDAGKVRMTFSRLQPEGGAMVALLSRGSIAADGMYVDVVSDPTADPALRGLSAYDIAKTAGFVGTQAQWLASLKGRDASAYLGAVTIGQTATVAVTVAAGARRVLVTVPTAMGIAAGDSLYLAPTQVLPGYVISDVVAVDGTTLSVGLTGPALAVGTSYKISCKLFRLNT